MKNIMLLGISRSGKSSFANYISNNIGNYNLMHGDMIRVSYMKNIDTLSTSTELKNDINFRNFIKDCFVNECKYYNKYNKFYILDTVDVFPSDLSAYDIENNIIIFFGMCEISKEELLNIWKEVDTNWIKNKSDLELYEKANRCIENSKKLKEECDKLGLLFIDTSYNRNEIFQELFKNKIIEKD